MPTKPHLSARLTAELLGTFFLVAAVVGSGIMAQQLSADVGVELLANTAATAGVLVAIILAFGPVSGAHFNPVVTLVDHVLGGTERRAAGLYIAVQVVGAIAGTIAANLMFDLRAVDWSTKDRSAGHIIFAEGIATLGLLLVIFLVAHHHGGNVMRVAVSVAGYITAGYWFTSSTSFANPAVAIGRMFTDTFAGIEPRSVPLYLAAEFAAFAVALGLLRVLVPEPQPVPVEDTLTGTVLDA